MRTPAPMPLPRLLRTRLSTLLGADLRRVRVSVSPEAEAIGALAFARGNDVVLSPRVLALPRVRQRAVLGHELLHVLQQRAGATRGFAAAEPRVLEAEAERAGRRIAAGRAARLRARTPRPAAATVQRIKLTLYGTKDGDLDAPALLHLMDTALASRIAGAAACAKVRGTVTVTQGGHWLSLLGKLAFGGAIVPTNVKRDTILPCTLQIGLAGSPMPVYQHAGDKGVTERLDFPAGAVRWANDLAGGAAAPAKLDLNYIQIANGFLRLNNAGNTDSDIAANMLRKMQGQALTGSYGADGDAFIEAVVALMFGVEGSRFASAFVSSLMLLDLIRTKKTYGRNGTKRFKLETAFDSGRNFDFNCLYGGKFPCAVHEPGKGNAANRRMLGELGAKANAGDSTRTSHFNRGQGVQMMMDLNHRFIVPRREVSLMIHWLEARVGMAAIPYIGKNSIQTIIAARIDEATGGGAAPALPYWPSPDTGLHSDDTPGYRNPIVVGSTVYWADYGGRNNMGKWYHTTRACKKFGGRTPGLQAELTSSYRVADRTKTIPGKGGKADTVVNNVPSSAFRTLRVVNDGGDDRTTVSLNQVRDLQYMCPHCAS